MRSLGVLASLLAAGAAQAAILTYNMAAHERPCFYTESRYVEEKMSVYFSVQTGGEFDLDYEVTAPDGKIVLSGTKEQTGDYVFSAPQIGEFKFCFFNTVASFAEKKFDFEILAQHEIPSRNYQKDKDLKFEKPADEAALANKPDMKPMEQSIANMHNLYGAIIRDLRYFRTRENRNFDTVKSTESRIFWFNISQNSIIIVTAIVQVIVIQTLFSKSGSGSSYGGISSSSSSSNTSGFGPTGGYGSSSAGGYGGASSAGSAGYGGASSGSGYGGAAGGGYGQSSSAGGYAGSSASSGYSGTSSGYGGAATGYGGSAQYGGYGQTDARKRF
ncbi:emp24/gp25L/p24 family/GOLD-domain-containing protein [Chytriomyces sp. MP71]|nr:emp24/gp25L/p24 family/GOLD-domain-containing protein [Chytriomyces sp. MP71]